MSYLYHVETGHPAGFVDAGADADAQARPGCVLVQGGGDGLYLDRQGNLAPRTDVLLVPLSDVVATGDVAVFQDLPPDAWVLTPDGPVRAVGGRLAHRCAEAGAYRFELLGAYRAPAVVVQAVDKEAYRTQAEAAIDAAASTELAEAFAVVDLLLQTEAREYLLGAAQEDDVPLLSGRAAEQGVSLADAAQQVVAASREARRRIAQIKARWSAARRSVGMAKDIQAIKGVVDQRRAG